MRAREILEEDYNQNLELDLGNILTSAKASGVSEIQTTDLVNQMQAMGYAVDENSIISLLQRSPQVLNATPSIVTLTTVDNSQTGPGEIPQDSAARVNDMAQKAVKIK